jgi:murein DD-endopeptidase MepM/ murein hydrolase activator NlpD
MLLMLFSLIDPMRSRRALLPLLAVVTTAVTVAPARAQSANSEKQQQLKNQILEAGAQEAAAIAQLEEIRNRKGPIDAKVAELDGQLRQVTARLAPLEEQIAQLEVQLVDAQARFEARQLEYEAARLEVERSAAQIYRSARRGISYDYVTAARPEDLVQGAKYLDNVNARQRDVVRRATLLRDEVDAQRKAIDKQRAEAQNAADEVAKIRDQIASLRTEIEPARRQAAAEAKAEEELIASLQGQKSAWEREWAELQAVSDAIAAQLRRNPSEGSPAGACDFRPTPGAIVSGFGTRTNPIGGGTGFHAGVDIAVSSGTPIRACRSGTVIIAGWQGGYGNTVVVDHGGGMATLYAHQSRLATSAGAKVLAGEVIGYVGSTGNSTGPHLHFEVRIAGNPVNPVPYI